MFEIVGDGAPETSQWFRMPLNDRNTVPTSLNVSFDREENFFDSEPTNIAIMHMVTASHCSIHFYLILKRIGDVPCLYERVAMAWGYTWEESHKALFAHFNEKAETSTVTAV